MLHSSSLVGRDVPCQALELKQPAGIALQSLHAHNADVQDVAWLS